MWSPSVSGISIALLLLVVSVAGAAPSGLNLIPTADILDPGALSLELESAGSGAVWGEEASHAQLLQVGLGYNLEVGLDHCLNAPDTWFNLKWRLWSASEEHGAVAVGIEALGSDGGAQPYVAACTGTGAHRFHAGAMHLDNRMRWMLGYDHPLSDWGVFQMDYISGAENAFSYGLAANLGSALSLTLAHVVGNSSATGNGHLVNLAWAAQW